MNYEQFERIFPALAKAGKSLEVRSSPGGAKSMWFASRVAFMAAMTGEEWGFSEIFLPNMNPSQMQGFMVPEKDKDGNTISVYSMPNWMLARDPITKQLNGRLVTSYKYGILLIEEWGQGEPETKKAGSSLLCTKTVGTFALPPGWIVVALSNRASDKSGVTKEFYHNINRRCELNLTLDAPYWEPWATSNGIHPVFISFAMTYPHLVFNTPLPEIPGPFTTARSFTDCSVKFSHMADANGNLPTDSAAVEVAQGDLGTAVAAELISHIKLGQEMPSFKDIIANPDTVSVPNRPDAQMIICYKLAHFVTEKTMTPVCKYMRRLPKEFALTFVKAATARDNELVETEAMSHWCAENATLLAAVQSVNLAMNIKK